MANCVQCGRKLPPLFFGKKICEWCVRHEAAQRGEEPEDAIQPVMPAPWAGGGTSTMLVTQAFVGICVAVFVAMGAATGGASITGPTSQQLIDWGGNAKTLTLGGQWWRLVTSMFVHIGVMHIFFNMWCLWDLGAMCESLYGHWTFAAVYMITGVAGSLASAWWHPIGVSAGASGAISGIVGALIASYYLGEFSLPRAAITANLRSLIMFVGYNVLFGAIAGRVDNAAHLGGLVSGLLFGALIARVAPGRAAFPRLAVVLLVFLVVFGSGAWLFRSRSYMIHYQHGSQLLQQNKADQALTELRTAVRQRPDFIPAHLELAHAYFIKDQFPQAEQELKTVLVLEPGNRFAYVQLGALYLSQKRTQQAKEAFQQLLARDNNSAFAHEGLGMALAAEENHPAAIDEYKLAAQLDPGSESVYYRLGLSQSQVKNYDEAIAAFLKQQQNAGDDYETEMGLAQAYRAKGMVTQADAAMRKAEQLKGPK
jgi:membrane associated rhomboid family serine protease/Flp pilus assembly protein TadD